MSYRGPDRTAVTWKRALLWLALVVGFVVAADQVERFTFYRVTKKDRSSPVRLARRPVKDALLAGLYAIPHPYEPQSTVPIFDLYLKPADGALLRDAMTQVQLIGTHDEFTKQWIGGRLKVEGNDYDVEVKLRGRQYYHVVAPRPSLRVKLQHGRTFHETTTFNLIDPFDKTGDQVFLWESRHHDLIAWDSTMGYLALRGEIVGVVQLVEQPRQEMSDKNRRAEGMFFRGSGEIYTEGDDKARCSPIVKRVVKWLGDTEGTMGWAELQELFDVERLRWFTALTEFSGDGHGFADFNMKGFCDPVRLKCEMLIWDTRFGEWSQVGTSQFAANGTQLLRCDPFRAQHDRALYELATTRLEPMLAAASAFNERYADLLAQDPFNYFPRGGPDGGFMKDRPAKMEATLRKNAADIRAALEGDDLVWHVDAGARTLELATHDRGSKELLALTLLEGDAERELALPAPVTVYGRYRDRQPVVVLPLPDDVDPATVRGVVARNACTQGAVAAVAQEKPLEGERVSPEVAPAVPELPALPAGFVADATTTEVVVGPGTVSLQGTLSLPRGWKLVVRPGTTIEAGAGALLEVRGDVRWVGTPEEPIAVKASGADAWGAIAVLGERTRPVEVAIADASFLGGAGSSTGSVAHTGSLALYDAHVRLERVELGDNTSEDALNLRNCTFEARDCRYHDGKSDAVDYDFCTGTDLGTRIERFGNDGIEISGSDVRIEDARIADVGNKGLSLGEGSTPHVARVTVIGARTGCVVKDECVAEVEDLTLVRPGTAVSLYRKKEGFEPPRATFRRLTAVDAGAMAIVDQGAQLHFVDSTRLAGERHPSREFEGLRTVREPGLEGATLEELEKCVASHESSGTGGGVTAASKGKD